MKYILIIVVLAAVGLILFPRPQNQKENGLTAEEETVLEPQINSEGLVEVDVTPVDVSPNSDSWKFNITLNTHSVELDQDLTKIGVLVDDKGSVYQPQSWEGTPPGGHHREGVLTFSPPPANPDSITLKIRGVGGVVERSFTWSIK